MILHGYWRSSASYRVRIALNLKGLSYEQVTHDLRTGAHRDQRYLALAPEGLVPAIETDCGVITQSTAIIEWLEERFPEPALLPKKHMDRALVRAMAAAIGCDIHPINNLRVLNALRGEFNATEDQIVAWISRWITTGFEALEAMMRSHGGAFAYGNKPTIADCYLLPQVYSAERFKVDLTSFPLIGAAARAFASLEPVAAAHPDQQPDADRP